MKITETVDDVCRDGHAPSSCKGGEGLGWSPPPHHEISPTIVLLGYDVGRGSHIHACPDKGRGADARSAVGRDLLRTPDGKVHQLLKLTLYGQ